MSRIGGPDTIQPLIKAASDDRDSCIRFEAVRQLRRIGVGYHEVLDLALQALEDPHRDVRSQAAWLLGNFQDERSIPALLRAMADAHWSVRESAEIALHNFGDRAVPLLIEALFAKLWTTQFRAARLLGELGDARAVHPLQKLLAKKRLKAKIKTVAEEALEKIEKRMKS